MLNYTRKQELFFDEKAKLPKDKVRTSQQAEASTIRGANANSTADANKEEEKPEIKANDAVSKSRDPDSQNVEIKEVKWVK